MIKRVVNGKALEIPGKEEWNYNLISEESKRINICKVLAIICVVMQHASLTGVSTGAWEVGLENNSVINLIQTGISDLVGYLGVPAFFLLSAVLLFRSKKSYTVAVKERIKTLLIPYVFWNTVWIAIYWFFQGISTTKVFFDNPENLVRNFGIKDWLAAYGVFGGGMLIPFLSPLWFLRDLMVMVLISPLIKKIVGKLPNICLIVAIVLLMLPKEYLFQVAFCWFIIGAYVVRKDIRVTKLDEISYGILVIPYVILILIDLLVWKNSVLTAIIKILGVLICIKLSGSIVKNERIEKGFMCLSAYTTIIYFGHEYSLAFVKMAFTQFVTQNSFTILAAYFVLPVFIIVLCIIAGYILRRFLPSVYKVITGNR